MKSKVLFLEWWLYFIAVIFGSILVWNLGLVDKIYTTDFTRLSFVIYGIFMFTTIYSGISLLIKKSLYRSNNVVWFISDMLLNLGIIGTVSGFIYTLGTNFGSLNAANPAVLQDVVSKMAVGMGTALYTTLMGLSCSTLLKAQAYIIDFKEKRLNGIGFNGEKDV